MVDLNETVDQLKTWVDKGQPNVFWISGFSFPTGFTIALRQQVSHKSNVPIEQFTCEFTFKKYDTSISAPAKEALTFPDCPLQICNPVDIIE
jgi:dynein heavy chain, axonemal